MGSEFNGLKSVELANWTGLAHIGKRENLGVIRKIQDLADTGVYLLTGNNEDYDGRSKVYIGETENFSDRISKHAREKDWWDNFIVFTSKDLNLTKAHVKHLEKELYNLAKESYGTIELINTTEPSGAKLPGSDIADMAEFLENLLFVIETLGIGLFISTKNHISVETKSTSSNDITGTEFSIVQKKNINLKAYLVVEGDKYILKKGSHITNEPTEAFASKMGYIKLWQTITKSDAVIFDEKNNRYVTTKDITFSASSPAGSVVFGRSTNGRTAWLRTTDGKPLGECQIETNDDVAA